MATLLLKKSYRHRDLKEIKFHDLWNSYGVFTTMRVIGKPTKILFFKEHIENLLRSLKAYKINKKNIKQNILKLIKSNLKKKIKYDHLFRIAANNKMISISLRKKLKANPNFSLKLINYKRIDPEHKNLKYKKILRFLKKIDTTKLDIVLCKNNKILESGTSNLLFIKNNEIYSPINNFYRGTTLKFLTKKIKKIKKRNIFINSLDNYDEIIIIGSGKGLVSVSSVDKPFWKRKSLKNYRILSKIYQHAITNCPRYNG